MRFAALVAVFACGFLVLLAGVLAARLAWGPIAIEGLSQRVAAALNSRVGDHWRVRVREARVDHAGFNPALSLDDVEVIAPDGERVLLAPQATVAVDPWSLVWGHFRPRAIVFRNISLRLALGPDGAFDLIGAPEGEAVAPLAGA
ncbi:hypothetical protein ACFOEX_00495, partial [Camelimonas abortus]